MAFLDEILSKYPKRTLAVEELSNLLSIGKDAVYRRLRGDSELNLEEVNILANHHNVSLDELIFQNHEKALFTVNSFQNPVTNYDDYLKGLINYLDNAATLPNAEVIYATAEIPMFLYGTFPEVMCFKLYIWGQTVWGIKSATESPFSLELFSPETISLMKECSEKYMSFNSTELWCLNIFDNTLNQIEFVLSNGNFKNVNDALKICDSLSQLNQHVCKMAELGKKFSPGQDLEGAFVPFELYHNELVFTNNTIMLKSDLTNIIFSTYDSPNVLSSSDKRIFNHTMKWFEGIKNKSEYITEVSERNRNLFFNKLERKVEKTRNRIKAFIESDM